MKPKNKQELDKQVDAYNQQIEQIRLQIAERHRYADSLRNTDDAFKIERIRSEADAMGRKITYRERRLQMLKELGAVLMTGELAGRMKAAEYGADNNKPKEQHESRTKAG